MSQYNQSTLISASNAVYVTNTSGQITALSVRKLNSDWISSSALVAQTNTFLGNQNISGSLVVSGAISASQLTASLQQGYTFVGNALGRTIAVATSSFASLTDLSSLNLFTQSIDSRVDSLESSEI